MNVTTKTVGYKIETMKILQKIMTALAVLVFLLLAGVLICAVNPNLSQAVGSKISSLTANRGDGQVVSDAGTNETQTMETQIQDESSQDSNSLTISGNEQTSGTEQQPASGIARKPMEDGLYVKDYPDPYQAPEQDQIQIPGEVQGYTGLEPVQDSSEQVNEDSLDEIVQYVGYGESGEGLTFSEKFYPYYHMLDDNTQSLYRQIYANAQALNNRFAPIVRASQKELKNAFEAVVGDHPELFWLNTSYQCQYVPSGVVAEITLDFNRTADQWEISKRDFEAGAQKILDLAGNPENGGMTDADAEVAIHDALLSQISYDTAAEFNQSAYSALVNGVTVCAGYARAYQYLCQKCDIPCYYCTGYAGQNHAWNIVGLDDGYYNVDATWDDAASDIHAYFNKTDADFATDHIRRDLSVYLPPCNGEAYHYASQQAENAGNSGGETTSQSLNQLEFDPNSYYGYGDNHTLRTLGDTGISELDVKTTLKDYYDACYEKTTTAQGNNFTFQIVVSDYQLMEDIYNSYVNHSYEEGYGKRALAQIGASSWNMRVNIEALQGDFYLITHTVTY